MLPLNQVIPQEDGARLGYHLVNALAQHMVHCEWGPSQRYADKLAVKRQDGGKEGIKLWFVGFTDFPGVNISIMSNLLNMEFRNAIYSWLLRTGLRWLLDHRLSFYFLELLLLILKTGIAFLALPFQMTRLANHFQGEKYFR